MFFGIDASL